MEPRLDFHIQLRDGIDDKRDLFTNQVESLLNKTPYSGLADIENPAAVIDLLLQFSKVVDLDVDFPELNNLVGWVQGASSVANRLETRLREVPPWVYTKLIYAWKNGRHFTDDISKCTFLNEKFCVLVRISLKYVPRVPLTLSEHWFR